MTAATTFADTALGPQAVFRSLLDALARPGRVTTFGGSLPAPPAGMGVGLYAAALTLADYETPLWLAPELAAARDALRFHTGAPIAAGTQDAAFVLVIDPAQLPALADCALGNDAYPDRSTTLLVEVTALEPGAGWVWRGPGIEASHRLAVAGLPADFLAQWRTNNERFPRGVDIYLFAGNRVVGLPRTTWIEEG